MKHFIGVDVGTGSARAGVFDGLGALLGADRHPIRMWQEPGEIVEQSFDDIWRACVGAIRGAIEAARVEPASVAGLGFAATCSLVVLDRESRPLSVGRHGDPDRNVIVWMDHRAVDQARRINRTGHPVLRYVGGAVSPEMQTPKVLWLKEHLPDTYGRAAHFLDLSDALTFRATGSEARSTCTLACKWTYLAHEMRWDDTFFAAIGLAELSADDHARIGREVVEPGAALGRGLTARAADDLALAQGTPVGASLIDAHAGGVGTLGAPTADASAGARGDPLSRLGYIMGTSACLMATTAEPSFVPGVWGPYFSAMFPGLWLNEGGQSAAGAAIDALLRLHPARAAASALAAEAKISLPDFLERRILATNTVSRAALLSHGVHVLPDVLGNRSPHADPEVRAVIAGIGLEEGAESLDRLFVAILCGLAYGVCDVLDALRAHEVDCASIVISGGAAHSALVRQLIADSTGRAVVLPRTEEPVLLGAAMLGAVAAGAHLTLAAAAGAMSALGEVKAPEPGMAGFHAAKREVHRRMQSLDRAQRDIMAQAG